MDALVCPLLVEARQLADLLPGGQGWGLPPQPGVAAGLHPVIVEIWRVRDGRMEMAGVDAHAWSALAAAGPGIGMAGPAAALIGATLGGLTGAARGGMRAATLGPLGWWWGAFVGAAAGSARGATLAGAAGAFAGGRLAAKAARRFSEAGSRIAGSYSEVVITFPCTRARASSTTRAFAFVLAMYTDSVLSRWGERLLGFGYRKRAAQIVGPTATGVRLTSTGSSQPLLQMRIADRPPPPPRARAARLARQVVGCLDHPLLGTIPSGRMTVSHLDRSFGSPAVAIQPVAVHLETSAQFLPGLDARALHVAPLSARRPWGAFTVARLPVTLSYPRAAG